jgi:hypothetical protein
MPVAAKSENMTKTMMAVGSFEKKEIPINAPVKRKAIEENSHLCPVFFSNLTPKKNSPNEE